MTKNLAAMLLVAFASATADLEVSGGAASAEVVLVEDAPTLQSAVFDVEKSASVQWEVTTVSVESTTIAEPAVDASLAVEADAALAVEADGALAVEAEASKETSADAVAVADALAVTIAEPAQEASAEVAVDASVVAVPSDDVA